MRLGSKPILISVVVLGALIVCGLTTGQTPQAKQLEPIQQTVTLPNQITNNKVAVHLPRQTPTPIHNWSPGIEPLIVVEQQKPLFGAVARPPVVPAPRVVPMPVAAPEPTPAPAPVDTGAVKGANEAGKYRPHPPFQEAHWQGLEVIPLTRGLRRVLKIGPKLSGVLVDDVTLPADEQSFQAGDLVTSVRQTPTPDLNSFIDASDKIRDRRRVELQVARNGQSLSLVLTALGERLGTANGETAPMIKPGSPPPHGNQGPCTSCHRIGTTGQLPVDQGDLLSRKAPPIRAGSPPPHRNRGECAACHTIVP
ncbi:MAG: PDZ domain-containing protein [Deltaproteobacteria bacterium]|nr:PDZ domain-containing protein [Deltaproteobacteria bacterium]